MDESEKNIRRDSFKKMAGYLKRHKPVICGGMEFFILEQKLGYLCEKDEDYKAEKKVIDEDYDKKIRKLKDKYAEKYLEAGLL